MRAAERWSYAEVVSWLSRFVVVASTFAVGCAALAGIDDGPTMSEEALSSSGGTSSGASGTSGNTSSGSSGPGAVSNDSGTNGDASTSVDAADAAPACTKKKNGATCAVADGECCGKCAEDLKCHNGCTTGGCNPFTSDECCAGSYCFVAQCRTCKGAGATPDDNLNGSPSARSCCSKAIESTTMKCK